VANLCHSKRPQFEVLGQIILAYFAKDLTYEVDSRPYESSRNLHRQHECVYAVGLAVPLHVEVSSSLFDPVRRFNELVSDIKVDKQRKNQGYHVPQDLVNDA